MAPKKGNKRSSHRGKGKSAESQADETQLSLLSASTSGSTARSSAQLASRFAKVAVTNEIEEGRNKTINPVPKFWSIPGDLTDNETRAVKKIWDAVAKKRLWDPKTPMSKAMTTRWYRRDEASQSSVQTFCDQRLWDAVRQL